MQHVYIGVGKDADWKARSGFIVWGGDAVVMVGHLLPDNFSGKT
jgi:hypothetical protein